MFFLYFAIIFLSNILTALAVTYFCAPLLDLGRELQHRKAMSAFKSSSSSTDAHPAHY